MALNDNAVLLPAQGAVLVGTVGTAVRPTYAQLQTFAANQVSGVPAGWTHLGHTSVDDLPAFGQDGGDSSTQGSWQAASLRTQTDPATDYVDVNCIQLDNNVMELFYGGGTYTTANLFNLPDTQGTLYRALTIVYFDGSAVWGFHAYRTSVVRADAPTFASDGFAMFPLRFTILQSAGQPRGSWIGPGLGLSS